MPVTRKPLSPAALSYAKGKAERQRKNKEAFKKAKKAKKPTSRTISPHIFVGPTKLPGTKAWKMTSFVVRALSNGICYTCEKPYPKEKLNAGHLIEKRGAAAIYFELDGLRSQCFYCNRRRHGAKDIYYRKLVNEIGQERVDALYKKARGTKQWSTLDLYNVIKDLEKRYQLPNNGE